MAERKTKWAEKEQEKNKDKDKGKDKDREKDKDKDKEKEKEHFQKKNQQKQRKFLLAEKDELAIFLQGLVLWKKMIEKYHFGFYSSFSFQ